MSINIMAQIEVHFEVPVKEPVEEPVEVEEPEPEPVVVLGGDEVPAALKMLGDRQDNGPVVQRELFAKECRAAGTIESRMLEINKRVDPEKDVNVCTSNIYYCRCRDKDGNETINAVVSYSAIRALLDGGVDVLVLNEVVFDLEVLEECGRDEYLFPFFSEDDFIPAAQALKELRKDANLTVINGDAYMSSMYHKRFGNIVIVREVNVTICNPKKDIYVVRELIPVTEEDYEGRSAVFVKVQHKHTKAKLLVCGTHLTEKMGEGPGVRQQKMTDAIISDHLPAAIRRMECDTEIPVIVAGDMNINQESAQPKLFAAACQNNRFLKQAANNPYVPLSSADFVSAQTLATRSDQVLRTVWNGSGVDYIGCRGVLPHTVGVIPPVHEDTVVSDHAFPFVVVSL